MEVTKGELYFREKLGGVQDAAGVNSLVLEWVESLIQDSSLLVLSKAFMAYPEQVMDVIWLLSQEVISDALAFFLVHFISSGNIAYLSKLAIERLDPELLEKAGVITQAAALMKKMGRINTQLHYKYHKNLFLNAEEMEAVVKEMEAAVNEKSRFRFFWTVGKWELDLNRAVDILLVRAGAALGVQFLLEILLLSAEKLKEFLQLRFLLQWHSPHYKREQVVLSCQMGISLIERNLMTLEGLEEMTWPKNVADTKNELDNWVKSIKAGSVMGESAPFYEPLEEYRKVCKEKMKNQRVLLYQVICEDERFQAFAKKMTEEEPFLEWFLVKTQNQCSSVDELVKKISLSGPMPWLHEELWARIMEMCVENRFALYEKWDSQSEPCLLYSRSLSLMSVKRFLRRLSKENVRQYCRLLGKVSHANPVTVLTALVEQVMVYDNLTAPVIESLRYLTVLEFDVLSFAVIRVLERALRTRRGLKEGTSMLAPWLSNLANFVACLFKRYGNGLGELGQVLKRVYELMREREDGFVMIVFVTELLREMAVIGSPEDTNDRILLAKAAGGPQLQKLLIVHGESIEEDVQRSSKRLFSALKSSGLLLKMYIALCQVRERLLLDISDSRWYHVKVVGEFADRAAWTMQQYAEFLCTHHKHRLSPEDLSPLDDVTEEYNKYLKRRLSDACSSGVYIKGVYEEEIAKLGGASGSPNDKLKKKILEEEMKGLPSTVDDMMEWSEVIKRSLISVPDAWEMASFTVIIDWMKLEKAIKLIVPWLTPYEAHNFGKFLDRLVVNSTRLVVEEEEDDGVQSVSSKISKGIAKMMTDEGEDNRIMLTDETPPVEEKVAAEEGSGEELSQMLMEDGEMQDQQMKDPQKQLSEIIFEALLHVATVNSDHAQSDHGGEDEVYVLRRNFMIILWHLKAHLTIAREDVVQRRLHGVIESIKEEESREDLRVMASRVITIFPSIKQSQESKEQSTEQSTEKSKEEKVDKKRKLQEYGSDDEEGKEVKKVKSGARASTTSNSSSTRRQESSIYSTSHSHTSSRSSRDYYDRKRYEDSYYSSSRYHRR